MVTGVSGQLGRLVLDAVVKSARHKIIATTRSPDDLADYRNIERKTHGLVRAIAPGVMPLAGDVGCGGERDEVSIKSQFSCVGSGGAAEGRMRQSQVRQFSLRTMVKAVLENCSA